MCVCVYLYLYIFFCYILHFLYFAEEEHPQETFLRRVACEVNPGSLCMLQNDLFIFSYFIGSLSIKII